MTTVSVVGSTGSIGTQALEVAQAERRRFDVVALAAHRSVDALAAQARALHPEVVAIGDVDLAADLKEQVPPGVEVLAGPDGLAEVATRGDVVVNAVDSFAGLPVTLAALRAGKRLALANKQSLIAAGPVVQPLRATPGAELVPVDSEHSAIHQCLAGGGPVARVVITASGGPFRGRSRAELGSVTIDDALAHPTWSMGPQNTIDSSTLMNKGLEVIEAHELFGFDYDVVEVVVHPQSVVHSMVEFADGATIAQLSLPDMRLAIGYAMAWPDRITTPYGRIDWHQLARLDFEPPDLDAFPCLGLAYAAGRQGGAAPAWLVAANEVAVGAFLEGVLAWTSISDVVAETLEGYEPMEPDSVDAVLDADRAARRRAHDAVARRGST